MSTLSQFAGGGLPVGSICQAPYNLTDPAWLPCDGRAVLRATYPRLSACLPSIGTFTATSRTKSATPTSSAIANNGTVWVVTGAVGTNNLYTTTDGITYNARTTPAATDTRSILYDGTNLVAAAAGAGGPLYSSTGTSWSNVAAASGIVGATQLQTCMTWASSLGTVGRFCVACGAASFFTSDDRGVTWTSRTTGVSGNQFHVCWTGQKFIATGATANTIYTSADGITWAAQTMPFATAAATVTAGSIISDGAGKVLWIDAGASNRQIYTSLDHGVTWGMRAFAQFGAIGGDLAVTADGSTANYTNGRFCIAGIGFMLSSTDLIGWAYLDLPNAAVTANFGISYKSGVYLWNPNYSTSAAYTLVEDTTYMRLPYPMQNVVGTSLSWNNFMPFIKVQ